MIEASARGAWAEVESHLRPFVARRVDGPADVPDVLQDIYLRVQAGLAGLQDTERTRTRTRTRVPTTAPRARL